jgi:hypothetical protein
VKCRRFSLLEIFAAVALLFFHTDSATADWIRDFRGEVQTLTRNPDYETDIIVSDETLRESTKSFRTRLLGEVPVKGKQQLVTIHAVIPGEA